MQTLNVSLAICYRIYYLHYLLIAFIFVKQFSFQLLIYFLFATTRWGCHEKLGLLSFRANAESFFCPYRLQVRRLVAASKNFKVFMYKFVCNTKFSKTLVAKHISMLTEVKSIICSPF